MVKIQSTSFQTLGTGDNPSISGGGFVSKVVFSGTILLFQPDISNSTTAYYADEFDYIIKWTSATGWVDAITGQDITGVTIWTTTTTEGSTTTLPAPPLITTLPPPPCSVTCGVITDLRYLEPNNIDAMQQTMNNYRREQIAQYGIRVTYFRSNANWYNSMGPNNTCSILEQTYGETPNATYYGVKNMIVFMDMMTDGVVMNRLGYESDSDASLYINMDEFNQAFRDTLGWNVCEHISFEVASTITCWSGSLYGTVSLSNTTAEFCQSLNYNDLHYYDCGQVYPEPYLEVCSSFGDGHFYSKETKKHDLIYLSKLYCNACQVFDYTLCGIIYIPESLKCTGNGYIQGTLCGTAKYKTRFNDTGMILRPMEHDFFRIEFDQNNRLDYEITRVINRKLTTDGLNPLLKRYDWQISAVRREFSFETVVGAAGTEWLSLATKEAQNAAHEVQSDNIFDYSKEEESRLISNILNPDTVYGGYGNICTTLCCFMNPPPTCFNPYTCSVCTTLCTNNVVDEYCQIFKIGPGKIY